jgi:alpha-tubulin N-acetyltransferase 1
VVGLLKIGRKSLYVFDKYGDTKHVNAPCVLDFYIHESRQRAGLGKILFEYMLEYENLLPEQMAIDRPSEKLLGFLRKHYGMFLASKFHAIDNFYEYFNFLCL